MYGRNSGQFCLSVLGHCDVSILVLVCGKEINKYFDLWQSERDEIIINLLRYILKTAVVLFKVAIRAVGHFVCKINKH